MTRAYDALVVDLGGVLTEGSDPSWWRLPAAARDGMTGVLHTSVARTVEELDVLLDVRLPASA